MENNKVNENSEINELQDNSVEKVSGGRTALFPKIKILKDYCDYCNKKIDGETRYDVHINIPGKMMCNECFKREVGTMGKEAAVQKWMGVNANNSSSNINIDVRGNKNKN